MIYGLKAPLTIRTLYQGISKKFLFHQGIKRQELPAVLDPKKRFEAQRYFRIDAYKSGKELTRC